MIEVACQISIKRDGANFLGNAKIELLEATVREGSLSAAAKALKISYQHAWNLIDDMNSSAPEPLIIKQRGGANGGGAEISDYGKRVVKDYRMIEAQVAKLIGQINTEMNL